MAYHSSQPCDSYFVEDRDERTGQSYTKMAGRRRRSLMADELSRQACETYMEDIVGHMRHMEDETLPDVASIDIQQEIQWFMRPYLIDFLVEAHAAFLLLPETLFLAINCLDRYCSKRVVYKRHYQLVGCAALLIAAKYGDQKDRVPLIKELKSMCCSFYDEEMFIQMEWHVLNTLDWNVGHPTVDSWLQIALKDGPAFEDLEVEHMAWYLCEIAMYHKDFVSVKPSVMARASLALARGILGRPEVVEGHDLEVNTVLVLLSQRLDSPSQVLARKYAAPHVSCVSVSLDQFLRRQAAQARRVNPPTPPSKVAVVEKPVSEAAYYPGTPQKPYANEINGYLTPPITPEVEFLVKNGQNKGHQNYQVPQYPDTPPTPTRNTHVPRYQQYQPQYQHDTFMH